MSFSLFSGFRPSGDQPAAIERLTDGVLSNEQHQVILGVTGSGKTFTMANVICNVQKPCVVIAPNKTLAAQLYSEFRGLFPENAVEYFVSYYDYYQPEAYIPTTDTYIAKDSSINELIDRMRHSATRSVLTRRDVIVVASVSCIFGLGSPADYKDMCLYLDTDEVIGRDQLLKKLVAMQYERNDIDFARGVFRVRGDRVDIFPAYEQDCALRIDFFGDVIERISEIDPLRGKTRQIRKSVTLYPASHYVTSSVTLKNASDAIKTELKERIEYFRSERKLIEAQRIEERTDFDLEMMAELGYCHGIENYSRHLTGRRPGEPPPTLLDYFPDDFLVFIDESHITVPQIRAMHSGDRARKESLVRYGFRLPSALDNRPLTFEEFEQRQKQVIYLSATPGEYELEQGAGHVVEQIIRPTGLIDPQVIVRPAENQVDDLLEEIRIRERKKERVLVTTLTKRMAEDLSDYYSELGVRVSYLHSEIKTMERVEIIRDLRLGRFDVLVGINLLREGLDIPEVSLVAILDADKEGFLRSERALIQTCGRASRNVSGSVILYADRITKAISSAVREMDRRREIQRDYNRLNKITPATVEKDMQSILDSVYEGDYATVGAVAEPTPSFGSPDEIARNIKRLDKEMREAAKELAFEKAAEIRDRIKALEQLELEMR